MALWGFLQCFCAKSRLRIVFTNRWGLSLNWYSFVVLLKDISLCYYSQYQHISFDWFIKSSIIPLHYVCHTWVKFSPMQTGTVPREMFRWGVGPARNPSLVLWQSTPWQVTAKGRWVLSTTTQEGWVYILTWGLALIKWKSFGLLPFIKRSWRAGAILSLFCSFF